MNFRSYTKLKVLSNILGFKRVNYARNVKYLLVFSRRFLGFLRSAPHVSKRKQLAASFKIHFTSNASSVKINELFDDALRHKDLQKTLELFDLARRERISLEAKTYTQAIYLLMKNNEYQKLDHFYEEMSKCGFKAGEGVRVTLIRSYVQRKMWREAIDGLHQLENEDLLRHTRSFDIIIKGLLEENLVQLAFQLFERKLDAFHRISNGGENITRDVNMYAAMIKSCCLNNESQKLNNKEISTDTGCTSEDRNNNLMFSFLAEYENKHSLVYKLFQFFYNTGMKLSPSILDALKEWSAGDLNYIWSWHFCAINKTGKCTICRTTLQDDLPGDFFRELQEELIKLFSEDGQLELKGAETEELKHVRDLCKEKAPFNVIIDAQNLGLEGKRKGTNTPQVNNRIYEKRIVEVVKYFSKKNKTILLPLNIKALNDISGKTLSFLRSHCDVYIVKTSIDEDLVLLYAAALSGLDGGGTCVVTNDNWRDHCAMLSKKNHWKLLKWTRLNHVSFTITTKNRCKLHMNFFDPVLRKMSNSWHFPMDNGHWQCAKLNKKY